MTDTASPGGRAAAPPPLKYVTKLLYGVGSMAYGVKDVAFRAYLLWYYNYVIGADAALVSLAILAALVFDAVSDPIVGQISDSLRTRWGRRHPLMYLSAIPAAASFFFLWHPPSGLAGWDLFFYLAILSSAVRTFITLYEIPSSALAPELSTSYDDRTSIASYRYFFGYLGGIGMSVLALWIWLAPTEAYPIGQLNPAGYYTFGLVGSLLMFATVMISTAGTHHRIKYLRKLPPPQRRNPFETDRCPSGADLRADHFQASRQAKCGLHAVHHGGCFRFGALHPASQWMVLREWRSVAAADPIHYPRCVFRLRDFLGHPCPRHAWRCH